MCRRVMRLLAEPSPRAALVRVDTPLHAADDVRYAAEE